jgi:hypothetical protein
VVSMKRRGRAASRRRRASITPRRKRGHSFWRRLLEQWSIGRLDLAALGRRLPNALAPFPSTPDCTQWLWRFGLRSSPHRKTGRRVRLGSGTSGSNPLCSSGESAANSIRSAPVVPAGTPTHHLANHVFSPVRGGGGFRCRPFRVAGPRRAVGDQPCLFEIGAHLADMPRSAGRATGIG